MCVEWGKAVLFSLLSVWGVVVYVCGVGEGSIVFTVECVGVGWCMCVEWGKAVLFSLLSVWGCCGVCVWSGGRQYCFHF